MSPVLRLAGLLEKSGDPDNPSPDVIRDLLEQAGTIGVVGLSRDPRKAARRVPSYLAAKGYEVIPVNPHADRILGRRSWPAVGDVPDRLELVVVFRPSAEAGAVVEAAAARDDEPAIWLQEGIMAPDAAREARKRGRVVVQDLCIFKAHRALEPLARR